MKKFLLLVLCGLMLALALLNGCVHVIHEPEVPTYDSEAYVDMHLGFQILEVYE